MVVRDLTVACRMIRKLLGWRKPRIGRQIFLESEPKMHISKEGDPYLQTLLVQGAQHILGPFGVDCDLRRWGLKLPNAVEKAGKSEPSLPRKTARGVAASLVGERRSVRTAAQQPPGSNAGGSIKFKIFLERKKQKLKTPSSGDCVNRLGQLLEVEKKSRLTGGSTG